MKRYNSKIGVGITLFITAVLGIVTFAMVMNKAWPGLTIIVLVTAFISYLFRTTYYLIDGNQLIVKCGFMVDKTIPIDRVYKIVETNNTLNFPDTSLDRLAIYYNQKDWIMISHKKKEDFIIHITSLNGEIVVFRKNDKLYQH